MKKGLLIIMLFLAVSANAQVGLLERFDDPVIGHTVFVPKGCKSLGISGSYRSIDVGGEKQGDGYYILSLLNIGDGSFSTFEVSPSFSFFVDDDLALGFRIDYSGYKVNTDLKVDLRNFIPDYDDLVSDIFEDSLRSDLDDLLNLQISGRHLEHHAWGASFVARKYLSFFGSSTIGLFGESRLYGKIGRTTSYPFDSEGYANESKTRTTDSYQAGLKFAAGVAVRLSEGSTLTLSIPLVGATYSYSKQHKMNTGNDAYISSFNIARNVDFMGIQVGYSRYIDPKKKH